MGLRDEGIGEECGIFAWYSKSNKPSLETPRYLIRQAMALQHRGQESAGIAVYNPEGRSPIVPYKDVGLVSKVFEVSDSIRSMAIIEKCVGVAGIGHVRYSTSGSKSYDDSRNKAQPFERRHGRLFKRFAIAFNGNLANYPELSSELMKEHNYWLDTDVDTEVIMHYLALGLREDEDIVGRIVKPDMFGIAKRIMRRFDGAFNILTLFGDGDLMAFRDSNGFHPLVFGENEEGYAFASESTALEKLGIRQFKDVNPGEAYLVNRFGVQKKQVLDSGKSFCQFEYVYFMKGDSRSDGVYIHEARENLGRRLAISEPFKSKLNENWVVVPAPWTAIPAAEAYSEYLGLKLRFAIEKSDGLR